jgi:hypothetical protein
VLQGLKDCRQSFAASYIRKQQNEKVRDVLDKAWKVGISRIEAQRDDRRRERDQWVTLQEQRPAH